LGANERGGWVSSKQEKKQEMLQKGGKTKSKKKKHEGKRGGMEPETPPQRGGEKFRSAVKAQSITRQDYGQKDPRNCIGKTTSNKGGLKPNHTEGER